MSPLPLQGCIIFAQFDPLFIPDYWWDIWGRH